MSASSTPTAKPAAGERGGQVGGDRRLADAALAGGHRQHPGAGRHRVRALAADVPAGAGPWPRSAARRSSRSSGSRRRRRRGGPRPGRGSRAAAGPAAGSPAVVRATVTSTRPSSPTVAPRAMPRSTMSEPSSGSITPRRAARTSSGVGAEGTTAFYRPRPCKLGSWTRWTRPNPTDGAHSTSSRRSATTRGTRSTWSWPARRCRSPPPRSPRCSTSTSTPCDPTSSACATSGLLQVDTETRGSVGRPQHRYSLAPDAPALGLEPSPWPTLARTLLDAAAEAGLDGEDLAVAGRRQGRADADRWARRRLRRGPGRRAVPARLRPRPRSRTTRAPPWPSPTARSASLAEERPDLVCALHGGMVEGFVAEWDGCGVGRFHPLVDRAPCQVELELR